MQVGDLNKTIIGTLIKGGSPELVQKLKMDGAGKPQKDHDVLEASKEFEGLFIQHLMNEMMKNTGDEFMGKGLSGDIFRGLFVEKMSKQLSAGRGMGLADIVYEYFEKTGLTNNPDPLREKDE